MRMNFAEINLKLFKTIMRNRGLIWLNYELTFNRGLNRANQKPETKKKGGARTFKVAVEILTGAQLHKIKSLKLIRGAIESIKH